MELRLCRRAIKTRDTLRHRGTYYDGKRGKKRESPGREIFGSTTETVRAGQGGHPLIEHKIRLEDPRPIKHRYHPRNPPMQHVSNEELEIMLNEGSNSPWSSSVVITRRKDDKSRFCIDSRWLNNVTKRDAYPLPQVIASLGKLRGAPYLSTIDLENGYRHLPLTEASKPLIAVTVQRLLDQLITPDMAPHAFL